MDEQNKFQKVNSMKNYFFILFFLASTSGCLLHPLTTEKSAIVLFNNTPHEVFVKTNLNDHLSPSEPIAANEASYVLLYEANPRDTELPKSLEGLWISTTECSYLLDRSLLSAIKKHDDRGRAGWNIFITIELLEGLECQ